MESGGLSAPSPTLFAPMGISHRGKTS